MRLEKIHRVCTCIFVALCCATLLFAFVSAAASDADDGAYRGSGQGRDHAADAAHVPTSPRTMR